MVPFWGRDKKEGNSMKCFVSIHYHRDGNYRNRPFFKQFWNLAPNTCLL